MSRNTKFQLKFTKAIAGARTSMGCRISLIKSNESNTVFCTGIGGRRVKTIKVLTQDDEPAAGIDDIEKIVSWSDLETYYPYRDPETGEQKLVKIDKKAIQSIYQNSDCMSIEKIIDAVSVKPYMMSDSHYFIDVQRDKKTKGYYTADQKIYTIFYHFLLHYNKYMLVKFIASNREKFAVIYSDPLSKGLRMTILIHTTYQRERKENSLMSIKDVMKYSDKLLGPMITRDRGDATDLKDTYEERLRGFIKTSIVFATTTGSESGAATGGGKIKIRVATKKTVEPDILSMIDELET